MVKIVIDNSEVDASIVTCNHGLNYGRFDAPNLSVHNYAVSFPRSEFLAALNDTFEKCMLELKHDDELTGEESNLAVAGWPSFTELLDTADLAADTIETFFDRDAFDAFGLNGTSAEYVINSTESVHIRDDAIIICGRCFRRNFA